MQRGAQGTDLTVEDLVGPTDGFDVNDLSVNSFGGYDDGDDARSNLNLTQDSVTSFSDHNTSAELAVDQLLSALRKKEAENTALKERTRRLQDHERTLEDKVANLDVELEAVSLVWATHQRRAALHCLAALLHEAIGSNARSRSLPPSIPHTNTLKGRARNRRA